MFKKTKVMIVEDNFSYYECLHDELNILNFECWPSKANYTEIQQLITNKLLDENDDKLRFEEKLDKFYHNLNIDAIILDIDLIGSKFKEDKSGITYMKYLRKYFPYSPILILTKFTPLSIQEAFADSYRVFYLEKIKDTNMEVINNFSDDASHVYKKFIRDVVGPVLRMIINWDNQTTVEKMVNIILEKYTKNVIDKLDEKFGIMDETLESIFSREDQLIQYSKLSITALKYLVNERSQRAGEIIDKLIKLEGFENIINVDLAVKYQIQTGLTNAKEHLIDAMKGKGDQKFDIVLKQILKDILNCDDDDTVYKKTIMIILKQIARNIKIINVMYEVGENTLK